MATSTLIQPVGRMAVVVRPREPFMKWLGRQADERPPVEPGVTHSLISGVVLIEDTTEYEQFQHLLDKNWRMLVVTAISRYCGGRADEVWPTGLDAETFSDWFDIELIPSVWGSGISSLAS